MTTISSPRLASLTAVGFALALGAAPPARAQLVEIEWDSAGTFERSLTVAPAKFVEVCGKLFKAQSIDWTFTGQQPLNFNIHYHEGKKVVFPARQDNAASLRGTLGVPVSQHYCCMWENKSGAPAPITLRLRRG